MTAADFSRRPTFADAFEAAARAAAEVTLPEASAWWPFARRQPFRLNRSERERATEYARKGIEKKYAELQRLPPKEWLEEHVRRQMGVKPNTRSALWIALFVARLLLLLAPLFMEEGKA